MSLVGMSFNHNKIINFFTLLSSQRTTGLVSFSQQSTFSERNFLLTWCFPFLAMRPITHALLFFTSLFVSSALRQCISSFLQYFEKHISEITHTSMSTQKDVQKTKIFVTLRNQRKTPKNVKLESKWSFFSAPVSLLRQFEVGSRENIVLIQS